MTALTAKWIRRIVAADSGVHTCSGQVVSLHPASAQSCGDSRRLAAGPVVGGGE